MKYYYSYTLLQKRTKNRWKEKVRDNAKCSNNHNEENIFIAAMNSIFVIVPSWEFGLVFIIIIFFTFSLPTRTAYEKQMFLQNKEQSVRIPHSVQLLFCLDKVVPTVPFQGAYDIRCQTFSGMQKHTIRIATKQ